MIYLCLISTFLTGCATTKVERVDVSERVDISGKWNDYDSFLTSKEMIDDCVGSPWWKLFYKKNLRNPIIIVGHVLNKTHEHIKSDVFVKYLERSLLNTGEVDIVASAEERMQVRRERSEQQEGFTDPETIKQMGKEQGADFMLIGSVHTIKDEAKGKYVILYQVNLELVDLETNKKVWIGTKQIKKIVKNARYSL
ncbi:MAG: penicillin-binding protein activator LpoB [Candidatus Omnitrophica bacterium]|nr:penicillin-binding protein activator LpoB [Candidatus Omnitrophota bacterium]